MVVLLAAWRARRAPCLSASRQLQPANKSVLETRRNACCPCVASLQVFLTCASWMATSPETDVPASLWLALHVASALNNCPHAFNPILHCHPLLLCSLLPLTAPLLQCVL